MNYGREPGALPIHQIKQYQDFKLNKTNVLKSNSTNYMFQTPNQTKPNKQRHVQKNSTSESLISSRLGHMV